MSFQFEFPCPHCSIPLRLRDKALRGRTIPCPECRQDVLIDWDGENLTGRTVEAAKLDISYPQRRWTPLQIVMGIITVGVLSAILWSVLGTAGDVAQLAPAEPADTPVVVDESVTNDPATETAVPEPQVEEVIAETRLKEIHGLIQKYLAMHHKFPVGGQGEATSKDDRFSWIARTWSEQHGQSLIVDWGKAWNAPVNEQFTRRRQPSFVNSAVTSQVGEDQYPPTHFVGITGYGPAAAELEKTDPRAGIFGWRRQTTATDVRDGLGNTLLVAGVTAGLGSWARAGKATMRGFEKQPYINGPDGFGTGQTDGMFILLADGSVRFLTAETDRVVLERMAAMADGLPLDPTIKQSTPPPKPDIPLPPAEEDLPIEVPLAPDLPEFDIRDILSKTLLVYHQSQPTPVGRVITEIEELLAVPLDVSQVSAEQLQTRIVIKHEGSLDALLQQVCEQASLEFSITTQEVLIKEHQ